MPQFTVHLYQEASQSFKVEADDVEDAIEKAFEIGMDQPNISNKFDFGGEDQLDCVIDADGKVVYTEPRH